jgi:hypothetical protein
MQPAKQDQYVRVGRAGFLQDVFHPGMRATDDHNAPFEALIARESSFSSRVPGFDETLGMMKNPGATSVLVLMGPVLRRRLPRVRK